jgi:VIT1/CCC1 family predicted Fe2+/Mn2+ transporter
MAHRYLSYTDRTGEIAFAVIMVIIINGYVALSNLNSGFLYIVAVNLGACGGWGFIDGFVYAISSSIDRNNLRNKLLLLKNLAQQKDKANQDDLEGKVEKQLEGSFLSSFSEEGKKKIATNIITYAPQATIEKNKLIIKDEALGWASIVAIYLTVGFLLALPFLVLPDKLLAWFISNLIGVAWLFWYGVQLGKSVGKARIALGFSMAAIGVVFLVVSYMVWT